LVWADTGLAKTAASATTTTAKNLIATIVDAPMKPSRQIVDICPAIRVPA
jgi:hypothetical protein